MAVKSKGRIEQILQTLNFSVHFSVENVLGVRIFVCFYPKFVYRFSVLHFIAPRAPEVCRGGYVPCFSNLHVSKLEGGCLYNIVLLFIQYRPSVYDSGCLTWIAEQKILVKVRKHE